MEEYINMFRKYQEKGKTPKKVFLSSNYYKRLIQEYPTTNTAEITTICGIPFEVKEDLETDYRFEA